ncbi:MAG: hypothetical protein FWE63_03935 [Bacteroidales bacterium]|nr:hypothetical protein [Bacteroidales bacterium]
MKKAKKYKQTIIPEVHTDEWETLSVYESRQKIFDYYCKHYKGKKNVINQHLGICVKFNQRGARKSSFGTGIYPKKKCLVEILDKMIEYAKYSNWGERKTTDPIDVIGYLNFKVKVKIDKKTEFIHLVIQVTNGGKFHYVQEINRW